MEFQNNQVSYLFIIIKQEMYSKMCTMYRKLEKSATIK